jgi:thioredoxin reductase (NADPH)
MTSDEIFADPEPPGDTLIIGGSYVAVELAAILAGFGFLVTMLVRSAPLKRFDEECVGRMLGDLISRCGVRVVTGATPTSWTDTGNGTVQVVASDGNSGVYRTVVLAIGREADTTSGDSVVTHLCAAGASVTSSGRLVVNETGSVKGLEASCVFAIGDAADGLPELQSCARAAAETLIKKLSTADTEAAIRSLVPITICGGLEFATVGCSEIEGKRLLGDDCLIYESEAASLRLPMRRGNAGPPWYCFGKFVCDASRDSRVVGCHLIMPHAADAIQAITLAMNKGLGLRELRDLVAAHPSDLGTILLHLREKRHQSDSAPVRQEDPCEIDC